MTERLHEVMVEQALKQRLVGAAVILAIGVIIIPVVLDSAGERQLRKIPDAPKPSREIRPGFVGDQANLPARDETAAQIILSLPPEDDSAAQDAPTDAQSTPASQPPAGRTPSELAGADSKPTVTPPSLAKPETTKKSAAAPAASEKPPAKAADTPATVAKSRQQSDNWVVQVGSFTDQTKAVRMRDQLRKKSFKAFVEEIRGRNGQSLYRVRVGPLPQREQAESLSTRLERQGFKGYVTRHP